METVFFVAAAMGVFGIAIAPIAWLVIYLGEKGLK